MLREAAGFSFRVFAFDIICFIRSVAKIWNIEVIEKCLTMLRSIYPCGSWRRGRCFSTKYWLNKALGQNNDKRASCGLRAVCAVDSDDRKVHHADPVIIHCLVADSRFHPTPVDRD
jgi:hypothetical protein